MDIGQQIDKWLTAKRNARGKKQNASSRYKKIDLSPEEAAIYANENAKKNGTTPEEEKALNQTAMDRDDAIEEATFAEDHPGITMVNEGGLVSGGGAPQSTVNVNEAASDAAATAASKAEEEKKKAAAAQAQIEDSYKEDTDTEGETGEETDVDQSNPPPSKAEQDYYNKAAMSIWDAYYAGAFGEPGSKKAKNTATYFTIDAIAKAAKNMGRSFGNIGAQFTGGAIDNNVDESDWSKRKDAILAEEIKKETEGVGSAATRQAESETLDNEAKKRKFLTN